MTIDDLYKEEGWVVFKYDDNSVKVLRTTLNPEVLKSIPGGEKENCLYDLDKFRWIPIPKGDDVVVQVYKDKPQLGEVEEFVNRFI